MFNRKKQELEARCKDLARETKRLEDKIKNRDNFIEEHKRINRKQNTIKEILELTECNTYKNEKAILSKIKELAQTAIKY